MTDEAPTVVVDTSVHLSGEIFSREGSPAKEVLARGFDAHFLFALSPLLLGEIARKMVECGVAADEVAEYLADLRVAGELFEDADAVDVTCADPDDVFVVVLGRTSRAWCIVAQDVALLDDGGTPPGWTTGFFLARLRERRSEPAGQRHP